LLAYKQKAGQKDFIGIFTAFQMSKSHYGIFTSDLIIYFYLDDNIDGLSQFISNKNNQHVIFALADSNQWKEISKAVINKRLFNSS